MFYFAAGERDSVAPRPAHTRVPDRRLTAPGCYKEEQVTATIVYSSPTGPRSTDGVLVALSLNDHFAAEDWPGIPGDAVDPSVA